MKGTNKGQPEGEQPTREESGDLLIAKNRRGRDQRETKGTKVCGKV
jgi:hypothetical protein